MSTPSSTGSPVERRPSSSKDSSQGDNIQPVLEAGIPTPQEQQAISNVAPRSIAALTTSRLTNKDNLKFNLEPLDVNVPTSTYPMNKLLVKLSGQQAVPYQQNEATKTSDDETLLSRLRECPSADISLPITPVLDAFSSMDLSIPSANTSPPGNQAAADEVQRLKLELAQAQNHISRLDQELAQTRLAQSDSGRGTSPYNSDPGMPGPGTDASVNHLLMGAQTHCAGQKGLFPSDSAWTGQDDGHSDIGGAPTTGGSNRIKGIWNKSGSQNFGPGLGPVPGGLQNPWDNSRNNNSNYIGSNQTFGPSGGPNYRHNRAAADIDTMRPTSGRRNARLDNRIGGDNSFGAGFGGYNMGSAQYEHGPEYLNGATGGIGMGSYPSYQQQHVGTPLSPHAAEFTSAEQPWKAEVNTVAHPASRKATLTVGSSKPSTSSEVQTFLPATEPLNYRRLLDRNVTCDWKYIVDKIVCNNDQQASIFLQQKLKVGTPQQKYDIVEAIVAQAYPLMVNRFGNFLVQRCFEHGTAEQVNKIADAIRGNTLNLSMDPFGCHVVQKAFDSVPEEYKAIMVTELLRRIPETVIHRYACHVWQKLFELRWTEEPPQIMKYVNEALRGMWHEVALGETGSLVVQNIFENCLEEDKRPCIEEVLANIDIVAHGQFGNWCIQHICEHGSPGDRSRAIDHVLRYAAEYSMDQFASKVVEKCLKIGGPEFLGRYLDRVCEGRPDRPRIPLVDISSDQYGNYLIQYILTHSNPQHREIVAAHVRKHMVSLRGSKFGSRVGMLCTNHAAATRPGPGAGPAPGRMAPGPRYSGGGVYR